MALNPVIGARRNGYAGADRSAQRERTPDIKSPEDKALYDPH